METISLRLDTEFLKDIERAMKKHRYSTTTEFIREALRDKISRLRKEETLQVVERLAGSSKKKTTDEELEKARDKVMKYYEKKLSK